MTAALTVLAGPVGHAAAAGAATTTIDTSRGAA
jgi:hypothetical protein